MREEGDGRAGKEYDARVRRQTKMESWVVRPAASSPLIPRGRGLDREKKQLTQQLLISLLKSLSLCPMFTQISQSWEIHSR